jgi:uncharacterized protein
MLMDSAITEKPTPLATIDSAETVAPVIARERISSVDTLRGLAVLGILLMNIPFFGLPEASYSNPTVYGGDLFIDRLLWYVSYVVFDGKMRGIFSMLFGAGVIILTSRAEKQGGAARIADIYHRRNLWLIAFGLCHAYFLWLGDILFDYGVVGMLLYPFRRMPSWGLISCGLLLLAVSVPQAIYRERRTREMQALAAEAREVQNRGGQLTRQQKTALRTWEEMLRRYQPGPEEIDEELEAHRSNYWSLFLYRAAKVVRFQSIVFYQYSIFDVGGMMLLGMAFMKLGIFSAERSVRFYWIMVVLGYAVGLPLQAYAGYDHWRNNFDPLSSQLFDRSTYHFARLAVALGHVGLVMLLCKLGRLARVTRALAYVGQMALTNYLLQSAICATIFSGYGFGQFGRLERYQLLAVVLGVWTFELILSPIWLRFFRFGPMEWLWRSLTYWKLQPILLPKPAL